MATSKIKAGDAVKFTKTSLASPYAGVGLQYANKHLVLGGIYEVSECSGSNIKIEDDPSGRNLWYNIGQFDAVKVAEEVIAPKEFKLPAKWCVRVTKGNAAILTDWKKKVSKNYFNSPALGYTFIENDGNGTASSRKEVITFSQFKQYVLKETVEAPVAKKRGRPAKVVAVSAPTTVTVSTVGLPQTFQISGDRFLLEAMWKELLRVGYVEVSGYEFDAKYKDGAIISCNCYSVYNKMHFRQFRELHCGSSGTFNKSFTLPGQYSEALSFAAAQLNHSYWEEEPKFKEGDWVQVIPSDNSFTQYPSAIGHIFQLTPMNAKQLNDSPYTTAEYNQKFGVNYRPKDLKVITAAEAAKALRPVYKVGDYLTVTKACKPYNGTLGETYEVISVVEGGNSVYFNEGSSIDLTKVGTRPATKAEIKKFLDAKEEAMLKQYKADDCVTVMGTDTYSYGPSCGNDRPVIGQTYLVKGVSNYVELKTREGWMSITPADLRKATEAEITRFKRNTPPEIKINGYIADFSEKGKVKFGCQHFTKAEVERFLGLSAYKITLHDHKGVDITPQIQQIYEYFNKQ